MGSLGNGQAPLKGDGDPDEGGAGDVGVQVLLAHEGGKSIVSTNQSEF